MRHSSFPEGVTRETLLRWFREGRARSREIFEIPDPSTYYTRPIRLRNPIVFYEGHLPAFTINTLVKLALKKPGIDDHYEVLFARGIDPDSPDAVREPGDVWPSRSAVQSYGAAADAIVERILAEEVIEDDAVPQLRGAEAAIAILEHEQMHQETLLYMLHNMPYERKRSRAPLGGPEAGSPRERVRDGDPSFARIPAGRATLGAARDQIGFGWDNEFPLHRVDVDAFEIGRYNVTNAEFLEFVEAGGYRRPELWGNAWEWIASEGIRHPHFWLERDGEWFWRGMFDLIPLPPDWPVYVTCAEAEAYARWKGMRIPTEAEYHRAAFGTPSGEERLYPWGSEVPDASRGNFGFMQWDPLPVGSFPAGASAWGVHDLVGNGWEWTATPFGGFPGFEPMASYANYSADFFDGQHYVLKGASPATARELVRRSFRNWFRPNYPYLYATFRLAR
ncbi:MAG TPA: SUMF1/EgtB/PvdO family nonheme iron enzyme [Thermoanaerobaculia bacterium]|nr:SUMF1/EgtB/PvdO family nonheme iron enzyme [Thermoanaerobaculia bacterium]